MTITSTTLLQAADAMAKAERARAWIAGNNMPKDFGVHLSWEWGRGLSGYDDVRSEVAKLLAEALPAWIDSAVRSIEAQAIAAVRDLSKPDSAVVGSETPICEIPPEASTMCVGCTCWKRTRADCG